ncbi:MAG: hypothetical protein OHK0040_09810 [bacterium]
MERKFLILKLGEQSFAIELKFAREIIRYSQPTSLPRAPYFFEGVIHLRGFFMPLIDTKRLLGIEHNNNLDDKKSKKILIVSVLKKIVGLKTDDIEDILRLDETNILPAPSLVSTLNHNYFSGGFYLNDRVIMILDMERLFRDHVLPHKVSVKEKAL